LINWDLVDFLIKNALDEDLNGNGDITSSAIVSGDKTGKAKVISKQRGIIAGLKVFERVFRHISHDIKIDFYKNDGDFVEKGNLICVVSGRVVDILTGERTALNFLQRLSGISTLTNKYVKAIEGTGTLILDTRKTIPAYRNLEKYAVKTGGGMNHRFGLYDMVLIKENHIRNAGSIKDAVEKVTNYLENKDLLNKIKVEVEVTNISEVEEALSLPVHRIMLDNMSVNEIKECLKIIDHKKEVEASGNITLSNIREIAETGVDFISVGAITHSALSFDVSMLFPE